MPPTSNDSCDQDGRAERDRRGGAPDRGRGHHLRLLPVRLGHRPGHGQGHPGRPLDLRGHKGFQLVYGATANLFIDRHGQYIGYGPEAAELVGLPDVDTFCVLPWDPKVARVFCTLFRGREEVEDPGGFLTSDCRGNLRRLHRQFTADTGLTLRVGCEPEMMWLKTNPDGTPSVEGVTKPYCYHIDQFSELQPVIHKVIEYCTAHGPRHDPGRPRGRPRPAGAELHLRPGRGHRRPPHHLPPGLPAGRPRIRAVPLLHAQAVHGRLGQRMPPQHLAVAGRREHVPARRRRSPLALARRACTPSAACWPTCGR